MATSCENLGLETGDFVEIIQDGGRVVIQPKQVVDPEDTLSPEDAEAVRQGIEDIDRGHLITLDELEYELDG